MRWTPPKKEVLKVNTDASFDVDTSSGSTGVVVRDYRGAMLRGQALWYDHVSSARVMEAVAIRDGVRLAVERGYARVIIESDAKEVIQLLDDDELDRSELKPICQEIRETMRAFPSFSVTFVGRDANQAAHLCARQASSIRRRCLWINYNPVALASTLLSDCTNVVD